MRLEAAHDRGPHRVNKHMRHHGFTGYLKVYHHAYGLFIELFVNMIDPALFELHQKVSIFVFLGDLWVILC